MESLLCELKKFHFEAYKNLVKTLVILNSAGIGSIVAYIGIYMFKGTNASFLLAAGHSQLAVAIQAFICGLAFILIEILIEYISYFFYKSSVENSESILPCLHCLKFGFGSFQLLLIIASLICLLYGGWQGFIVPIKN